MEIPVKNANPYPIMVNASISTDTVNSSNNSFFVKDSEHKLFVKR